MDTQSERLWHELDAYPPEPEVEQAFLSKYDTDLLAQVSWFGEARNVWSRMKVPVFVCVAVACAIAMAWCRR